MSDLVLDLAGAAEGLSRRLAAKLPADATVLRLAELKQLGARRALFRLRGERVDTCMALVTEFRRPGRWLGLLTLAMLTRARRRVLVDRHGATRDLSWRTFVGEEVPFVFYRWRASRRVRRDLAHRVERLQAG